MNVIDAIRHHVRMRPFDLAVVHPAGSVNYLQLAGAVSTVAARLRSQGIAPGTTVAIYVSDPFLHLLLVLAALLNGTVSVSAHPNYDAIPGAAGIDTYLTDRALPFDAPAPSVEVSTRWVTETPRGEAPDLLDGPGFPDPSAVCRLFTSSGTTGTPKVIAHTGASLEDIATRAVMLEPLLRGPNLCMMWISTIGGFNTTQVTLWQGGTIVLAVAPRQILRAINLHGVRFLRASPQQLQGLVDMVRGRSVRFPSLERVEVGGSSTPMSVVHGAKGFLCTNVVGVYGSTEAGLVAQSPSGLMATRSDAAGYVVPSVKVRIVDDAGLPLDFDSEGIVQIRTPHMVDRYLGDDAASAAAFRDGWFVPGDLGVLNAEGLLRITGRIDEMINTGGVKLSPTLVDDFLLTQPGVRDAAAFAVRRAGRSDQVWAAVVCAEGFDEEAVLAAARARLNSRAPVRVVRMDEIPRNAMGKPLRQQLSRDAEAAQG